MDINFRYLPLDFVKLLYKKANAALKKSLLRGDEMHDIKSKEQMVTELAIEIHRKEHPEFYFSPEEENGRRH
ncbi:MAG TPA: hypothetical protein VGO09_08980 [Flavisolibacter sp.]|jgi:hypothetical protein|nr:hypothetical protein [Flavisolibacter sp.]